MILIIGGKSEWMALADYVFAPMVTLAILIGAAGFLQRFMRPVWQILNGGR